nr:MAG TPA: hypothetical protein [Caudoviricetes sp.]
MKNSHRISSFLLLIKNHAIIRGKSKRQSEE